MPLTAKDWLEVATGDRLPIFRATSRHLSAIHPFFIEGGLVNRTTGNKIPGLPYGFYGRGRTGGIYLFDEVQLYQAGELGNINVTVIGDINYGKSSTIKFMIYNGAIVGYNHLVIDPKGEYEPLVSQMNREFPGSARIVKFGPNVDTFVNPLDRAMPLQTQRELLISLAATATGMDSSHMDIVQTSLLWEAIKEVHNRREVPTLPDLVSILFDPGQTLAERMRKPEEEVRDMGYRLALGLNRLNADGDMVGMFHKETTPGLFGANPLLVLDVSGIKGEAAVMMVVLLNFLTQTLWSSDHPENRFHKVIVDEAWDLAAYPEFVLSMQRSFKLGRSKGVANWIIMHRISDLERSGSHKAIKSLLDDSQTTIAFHQTKTEMENSARALGFNEAEVAKVTSMPFRVALHKRRDEAAIEVEHIIWPHMRQVVETSHLLHGQTSLPRAGAPKDGEEVLVEVQPEPEGVAAA